jgi:aryl-alcohol dehydrogenase-like predicted oxidoreductase
LTAKVEETANLAETDTRRRHPRFAAGNLAHNLDLVHRIEMIAQRKNCTPGQLALAWLLAQGTDVIPIPGTKRKERLLENLGALTVTLSEADIAEISAAIPPGSAAGTRYPEPQMTSVFL